MMGGGLFLFHFSVRVTVLERFLDPKENSQIEIQGDEVTKYPELKLFEAFAVRASRIKETYLPIMILIQQPRARVFGDILKRQRLIQDAPRNPKRIKCLLMRPLWLIIF